MMKLFFKTGKNTKGFALMMTAVMLPLLLLIVAFIVDLGLAYTARTRIESAAIASVEAGFSRLSDPVEAQALAESVARISLSDSERFGKDLVISVVTDSDSIETTISMTSRTFFAGIIGKSGLAIEATSRRLVSP